MRIISYFVGRANRQDLPVVHHGHSVSDPEGQLAIVQLSDSLCVKVRASGSVQ